MQRILKAKGYTLIEVLIALFIFVIVVAIVSVGLIQMLNNVKSIKKEEARILDIQSMLSLLTFDLSQAVNKIAIGPQNELKGSFYTHSHQLHFVKTGDINPNYQFNRSSLEEVVYLVENNQLIRQFKEDNQNIRRQVVLDGVTSIHWVFYDNQAGQYHEWPPTRDWQFIKPRAVKCQIELNDLGPLEKIIDTVYG